jgi:hypothetical protein
MTPHDTWQRTTTQAATTLRVRLANRAEHVNEIQAWDEYFKTTRQAWRDLYAADPDTASQLFADNMLSISQHSSRNR